MSENEFAAYLEKINFQKRLDTLAKKLKDKKIIIYGTGLFFQTLIKNYDLSVLNIVALSDKKFSNHEDNETFLGYKVCAPMEIADFKPDYVLVGTINFIDIIEDLEENTLVNTGIKIKPLIKKPFRELWEEIWR